MNDGTADLVGGNASENVVIDANNERQNSEGVAVISVNREIVRESKEVSYANSLIMAAVLTALIVAALNVYLLSQPQTYDI